MSNIAIAFRSITAAFDSGTMNMKLVMLRLELEASFAHPTFSSTLFVGDLSAEMTEIVRRIIAAHLESHVNETAAGIDFNQRDLSDTKSVCTTSTLALRRDLGPKAVPDSYQRRAKSIGVGLARGRKSCITTQTPKFKMFRALMKKFSRFKSAKSMLQASFWKMEKRQ